MKGKAQFDAPTPMSAQVLERQPTTYNDYSLERKAEVLALVTANGGNVLRTAEETGIAHQTIRRWLEYPDRYSAIQNQKSIELADQCESDARYYFHLAREKAPDAPYNHLMTGGAIMVDKMQLLRGQPTSITESIERQEIAVVLQQALAEVIDITPKD